VEQNGLIIYANNDDIITLVMVKLYFHSTVYIFQALDGEMFERLQQSLTELSKTELECCGITQECFSKALCDSCLISRQYNLQCFLNQYPAFTELMQYQFEPCENDAVGIASAPP
jgi:hypothetical protein